LGGYFVILLTYKYETPRLFLKNQYIHDDETIILIAPGFDPAFKCCVEAMRRAITGISGNENQEDQKQLK
jgi:hypothetical protein